MRPYELSAALGRISTLFALTLAISSMAVPSALFADWIVTRDGVSFEIDGDWQIEDDLVTFSLPSGTYSAMRLSSVDLDASTTLTEEKATTSKRTTPSEGKRKATIVITDADVYNPPMQALEAVEPDESRAEEASRVDADTTPTTKLEVIDWQERVDASSASLEISGTVKNSGANPATTVSVRVALYDDEGTLLTRNTARLDRPVLLPGESTRFVAKVSDVLSFDSADFEIDSRGFVNHPPQG